MTLALLDELSEHTLLRAADILGVSATALKIACRKLGVSKWHYHRRSDGDAPATPAFGSAPAAPALPAAPASWPACGGHSTGCGAGFSVSPSRCDDLIDEDSDGAGPEPDSPACTGLQGCDSSSWYGAGSSHWPAHGAGCATLP